MALGFDVPSIGLILMSIGAIMLVASAVNRTGKQLKRGDAALLGAVLGLAGIFMGGLSALAGLSAAPGPVGPPAPQALWDVSIADAAYDADGSGYTDITGVSTVVAVDGSRADSYGAEGDLDATAFADVQFVLVNLNQGDSTVTWQYRATHGSQSTIDDPAAGTSAPLIVPDGTDPSIPSIDYADVSADGVELAGGIFVDVVATAGSETLDVTVNINDAAMVTPDLVTGAVYSFSLTVAGISFEYSIHVTG